MDNKYIFVPYEGRCDANIFLEGIFGANILWLVEEKIPAHGLLFNETQTIVSNHETIIVELSF